MKEHRHHDEAGVYKTTDGLPFWGANRVVVDPVDRRTLWITTFGGGVWKTGTANPKS